MAPVTGFPIFFKITWQKIQNKQTKNKTQTNNSNKNNDKVGLLVRYPNFI